MGISFSAKLSLVSIDKRNKNTVRLRHRQLLIEAAFEILPHGLPAAVIMINYSCYNVEKFRLPFHSLKFSTLGPIFTSHISLALTVLT